MTSTLDGSCKALGTAGAVATQCRNTTTGIAEAIGTKAWNDTADAACKDVLTTSCRNATSNLAVLDLTLTVNLKTGQKSATDAVCNTAADTECRNASGVNVPLGIMAWTSATD